MIWVFSLEELFFVCGLRFRTQAKRCETVLKALPVLHLLREGFLYANPQPEGEGTLRRYSNYLSETNQNQSKQKF